MGASALARAVLALAAVVLAAGCTGDGAGPRMSDGPFAGELVSRDDAVPDAFPEGFPLPGDPTVLYSAVSSLGSVLYLDAALATDAIVERLLHDLPAAGWTVYACTVNEATEEPITTIVTGAGRRVASVVVGFSPSFAERIDGQRYTYFVSVADDAPEPPQGDLAC